MEAMSLQRRRLLGATLAAGATASLPAGLLVSGASGAQSRSTPAEVLTRQIPRGNERIPVIGLGTFIVFDLLPGQKRDHLREVLRASWEGGARVVDTSPLYGTGETTVGDFATDIGISAELFISNKIWSTGEYLWDESHARRSLDQSMNRLWRERIDVMTVHSMTNIETVMPMLRAWKKEGRIRYHGFTHFQNPFHDLMAAAIERESPDFIQINYSIANRSAEARVLPAAQAKGAGVFVNMPFEKARLFKVVERQPLPPFAREIGVENWAQYFLKWAASHPAVTCVIPATSDPVHAAENVGALRGPLPDAAMRDRMLRHAEALPGFDKVLQMPWYPDKRYPGVINKTQAEIRART